MEKFSIEEFKAITPTAAQHVAMAAMRAITSGVDGFPINEKFIIRRVPWNAKAVTITPTHTFWTGIEPGIFRFTGLPGTWEVRSEKFANWGKNLRRVRDSLNKMEESPTKLRAIASILGVKID